MSKKKKVYRRGKDRKAIPELGKNWEEKCQNCDQVPTVHPHGLCGPCFFGEADTINGNW